MCEWLYGHRLRDFKIPFENSDQIFMEVYYLKFGHCLLTIWNEAFQFIRLVKGSVFPEGECENGNSLYVQQH